MTKPEQLLKLAQIVEPDKDWKIVEGDILALGPFNALWVNAEMFYPENNDAQLMQVVFAFFNREYGELDLTREGGEYEASITTYESIIKTAYGKTREEAILNLAIEVLL